MVPSDLLDHCLHILSQVLNESLARALPNVRLTCNGALSSFSMLIFCVHDTSDNRGTALIFLGMHT